MTTQPKNPSLNPHGLTVGQWLFFVYDDRRRGTDKIVTVTKLGRKWAEIDDGWYRLDIETLRIDGKGYSSPGRCYLSEQEYKDTTGLQEMWRQFKVAVDRKQLGGITREEISQAAAALGLIGFTP